MRVKGLSNYACTTDLLWTHISGFNGLQVETNRVERKKKRNDIFSYFRALLVWLVIFFVSVDSKTLVSKNYIMVIVHENAPNLSIIAMFSDKYSHNFDIFLEKNLKLGKRGVVIKMAGLKLLLLGI